MKINTIAIKALIQKYDKIMKDSSLLTEWDDDKMKAVIQDWSALFADISDDQSGVFDEIFANYKSANGMEFEVEVLTAISTYEEDGDEKYLGLRPDAEKALGDLIEDAIRQHIERITIAASTILATEIDNYTVDYAQKKIDSFMKGE